MTVTGYRIILPRHWVHLPVDGDPRPRLRAFVDDAVRTVPRSVSPDQVGPLRRNLEEQLLRQVAAARGQGGRDIYLPGPNANGLLLGASIVVSETQLSDAEGEGSDADVLALLASEDGRVLELDGMPWVRHEPTSAAAQANGGYAELPTRRVTYTGRRPDGAHRWMLVAFSCLGDGDPTSNHTHAVVELFDAIMGTWVWARDTDPAAVLPPKELA